MKALRNNILISLLLWLIIAAAAWPAFVAMHFAISWHIGEGSVIDMWNQEPKHNVIANFVSGYKASAPFAVAIAFVAVIDFQLLTRHRLTGYVSGILIPVACVGLALYFFPEPGYLLPGFALTGLTLWFLYKTIDIGSRLRRVG